MSRDGLTYDLWCMEGSEPTLVEAGVESRPVLSGPSTEHRAAARRRHVTTYIPISMATMTIPQMAPVENSSMRLEASF